MKILLVHEVNYFRKPIYEFIEIPEALSAKGHDVTVVDYGEDEKKIIDLKTKEFKGNRIFKDSDVRVIRPGRLNLGDIIGRITAWISNWLVLRKLFKNGHFDAIILYSVPTNGMQAVHYANRYNTPVLFRAIDTLYDLRPYPPGINHIIRVMEKYVYKRSDYVLSLTPSMARYTNIKKDLPLHSAVNDNVFYPIEKKELENYYKRWGLSKTDKIITYIGTFYEFSGLETFIKDISRIKKEIPKAKLLLVGGKEAEKRLRDLAGDDPDIIFTGFVPYDDVARYINISDVCIIPFRECHATRDIVPIKMFQYLACKKPVVCRKLRGIQEIVPEDKGVVFAKTDDGLVDETIGILKDSNKKNELAEKGFEFCKKHHSWDAFIIRLEKHLITINNEGKQA